MFGYRLTSIRHFIFFSLLLALSLAACRAPIRHIPSSTDTPNTPTTTLTRLPSATSTPIATATTTATNTPTTSLSPTPTTTPTRTPTATCTLTPTITPTPYPPEKLVFVEQNTADTKRGIAFINSDGSGYERPEFLQAYVGHDEEHNDGIYLSPSPNGRYLAFDGMNIVNTCIPNNPSSPRDCYIITTGIFVADLQNQTILGNIEATSDNPSWSPESQRIVVSISVEVTSPNGKKEDKHNLVIYDLKTRRIQHFLKSFSDDLFPAWSPDGQWIAFYRSVPRYPCLEKDCSNSLYIVHPDGSGLKLLVDNIFSFMADHITSSWSPDSQWLAILSGEHELVLANVTSGEIRHLGITLNNPPQWSPDGSRLIFYSEIKGPGVYVISPDGEDLEVLTSVIGCCLPVWSPSGHFIVFVGSRDEKRVLPFNVMNADGTNSWKLEYDLGEPYPAWLPTR